MNHSSGISSLHSCLTKSKRLGWKSYWSWPIGSKLWDDAGWVGDSQRQGKDERCSKEISATRGGIPKFVPKKVDSNSPNQRRWCETCQQVMKNVRFITQITGYTTGTTLRSLRFHSSKGRISADYGCQAREFTEFILSSVLRMEKADPTFIHNW